MGRRAGYSKRDYNYRRDPYIDGNTVRQPERIYTAEPRRRREEERQEELQPSVSRSTKKNRERALQIDFKYVLFLFVAAAATVFACVNFLKLQAASTAHLRTISSLESQISELKAENDAAYDAAVSSVDLERVKEIATEELGMVYADQGQIITYDSQDGDYVRQYSEVP